MYRLTIGIVTLMIGEKADCECAAAFMRVEGMKVEVCRIADADAFNVL